MLFFYFADFVLPFLRVRYKWSLSYCRTVYNLFDTCAALLRKRRMIVNQLILLNFTSPKEKRLRSRSNHMRTVLDRIELSRWVDEFPGQNIKLLVELSSIYSFPQPSNCTKLISVFVGLFFWPVWPGCPLKIVVMFFLQSRTPCRRDNFILPV